MSVERRFLILQDDRELVRSLARVVGRYGKAVPAASVREARAWLDTAGAWTGFIVDVRLPDGNGLDLLAAARDTHPKTPAMVLTRIIEPSVVNRAFDLHAAPVAKPVDLRRIDQFLAAGISVGRNLNLVLGDFRARYNISESEKDVLERLVAGQSPKEIAKCRGTSELTVRKQIATLRWRTGDESVHELVVRVLHAVTDE